MSQQLRNIHNYSKPPKSHSTEYHHSHSVSSSCTQTEESTKNSQLNSSSPGQNGFHQGAACMFSRLQEAVTPTVGSTSWREKASIEDWKAYLLSTQPMPVNTRKPLPPRPSNLPYGIDANIDMNNKIPQQHPTAHISYSYAFNGGFKPMVVHATKRYSGAIDNRRAFMEKLRMNNTAAKDWFQSRLLENRMKSEYNYYPPGLLERIKLEKEKIRMGLAHVEALMNHPNEFGYVMLDERAMNVLVTIIDRILPKDINFNTGNLQSFML